MNSLMIEEIRNALDIMQLLSEHRIQTLRRGQNIFVKCMFHDEKTPSMCVYPDRQSYHCFGCLSRGDVINLYAVLNGKTNSEAIRELGEKLGLIKRGEGTIFDRIAEKCFAHKDKILGYIKGRGINNVDKFKIGYWDTEVSKWFNSENGVDGSRQFVWQRNNAYGYIFEGRLIIPIYNTYGAVVGIGGRVIGKDDSGAKYINVYLGESKANAVYQGSGLQNKPSIYITEGYFDTIAIQERGHDAIGLLGTAVPKINGLKRYEKVVIYLDSDAAGITATEKLLVNLWNEGIYPRVVDETFAKDPAEYLQTNQRLPRDIDGIEYFYRVKNVRMLIEKQMNRELDKVMSGVQNDICRAQILGYNRREKNRSQVEMQEFDKYVLAAARIAGEKSWEKVVNTNKVLSEDLIAYYIKELVSDETLYESVVAKIQKKLEKEKKLKMIGVSYGA